MDVPISAQVRSLLEFSIEVLVIGGGLPSVFLQRPAWMRELRRRYSWRVLLSARPPFSKRWRWVGKALLVLGLLVTALLWYFGPPEQRVFYQRAFWFVLILAVLTVVFIFMRRWDTLTAGPVVLGLIVLWHIFLAADWPYSTLLCDWLGWAPTNCFYVSLVLGLLLVARLWYQVYMTSFPQVAHRIYWIAHYLYSSKREKEEKKKKKKDRFRDEPLRGGWNKVMARLAVPFFSWKWVQMLYPHVLESWKANALRDLGRLGANTQTPQETALVLQALEQLAKHIPVYTHGVNAPMVQMAEATSQTLWPLEASDREAFSKAIQVFRTLFRRWVRLVHEREHPAEAASQALNTESPLLPHITRLGYAILDREDAFSLLGEFLKIFSTNDNPEENHFEARALFVLGLRALQQKQWDALLHLVNKLREYARCVPENAEHIRTPIPGLEDVLSECEGTFWLLGLLAMIVVEYPGARPWVRRHLSPLFDLKDEEEATILCKMLVKAEDFFTSITLEPEVARAVCAFPEALGVACEGCDGD